MLYISSIAALGRTGKENEVITEQTPWDRKTLTTDYSVSKFLAEREVWRGIAEGLKTVIVNPSVIIGAGNWNAGSSRLFNTVYGGFRYYTKGRTGYVDVRDVVKAVYLLMELDIAGERYILNAENITYAEMLSTIAAELGVKAPSVQAGKILSGIAWRAEWLKSTLSGQPAAVTRQTARIANKSVYFDATKVKSLLQTEFMPVKESIAHTAVSFLQEKQTGSFVPLAFT
jgi:nucleoside-diphosphate-sugar epimerase